MEVLEAQLVEEQLEVKDMEDRDQLLEALLQDQITKTD
jgi:hypothetical protein